MLKHYAHFTMVIALCTLHFARSTIHLGIFIQGHQLEINFHVSSLKTWYFFDTFHIETPNLLIGTLSKWQFIVPCCAPTFLPPLG